MARLIDLGNGRFLEEPHGELGLNLRQERTAMEDTDLPRCVNADLHTQPGAIFSRRGTIPVGDPYEAPVRRMAKVNGIRYRVAGNSVYRERTRIIDGLSPRNVTTILGYRPFSDTQTWAFIADNAVMRKDNGFTVQNWGIQSPPTAPTVAGTGAATGSLTGDYQAAFTYVRKVGSLVANESSASPFSATITLGGENLVISGLTASADTQVTHIRVYRTVAGGAIPLYDQEVTNGTVSVVSSQADSALGTEIELDNDAPPNMAFICEYNGHIFGCQEIGNEHILRYSKRFRPEAWPQDNYFELGNPDDPLQACAVVGGVLGVFSRYTKYRVTGNDVSGFVPIEAISRRGTPAWASVIPTERGIGFIARDGVFLTNLISPDEELTGKISPLFDGQTIHGNPPVDWSQIHFACQATNKGKLFTAIPVGEA